MQDKFYKTPEGIVHKILIYDDVNKMVCVQDKSNPLHNQWAHDTEYSSWVECDAYGEPVKDEVVEEIYQEFKELSFEREIPIKKAKTKKKA